jgi:CheY-like chemotaxis protein
LPCAFRQLGVDTQRLRHGDDSPVSLFVRLVSAKPETSSTTTRDSVLGQDNTRKCPRKAGRIDPEPKMTRVLQVLIVDDNRDLGSMLAEYLKEVGHNATAVMTSEEAMELIAEHSFDVMMTDVRLPGMSGIVLAMQVVARCPRMGIVISSGYGDALELEHFPAELASVVLLMPKPCDLAKLPDVLAEAMVRSRALHP